MTPLVRNFSKILGPRRVQKGLSLEFCEVKFSHLSFLPILVDSKQISEKCISDLFLSTG